MENEGKGEHLERGSLRMFRERFKNGLGDDLSQLEEVIAKHEAKIVDIWIKGQPPRIDEVAGTVRIDRDHLGATIERFLSLDRVIFDIWIRGQPPRLDMVDVHFETPGWH